MKNKINIAELLKDCPKGMELYSPIFGKVYLDKIRPHLAIVVTTDKYKEEFLYDGRYGMNGECMLFPSKGKTTWEGFQRPFKDGDIVFYDNCVSIFKKWGDETLFRNYVKVDIDGRHLMLCDRTHSYGKGIKREARFATEKEKAKLFNAIKAHGYQWNADTKTLEKLSKFKVGDKIKHKDSGIYCTLREYSEGISAYRTNIGLSITCKDLEDWELVPNKFDITTLVPFESRVLVRSSMDGLWKPAVFGFRNGYNDNAFYIVGGSCWKQCIPYLNNEHLCGTTNDCDEYYKIWQV